MINNVHLIRSPDLKRFMMLMFVERLIIFQFLKIFLTIENEPGVLLRHIL